MSFLGGNEMYVKVSAVQMAAPADGVRILGLSKTDEKRTAEVLDVTTFGDTFKRNKAGIKSMTLSLSGTLDPDDIAGQGLLEVGRTVFIALYNSGLAKKGSQAEFIVTELGWTADVNGKQEFSATLQGNSDPAVIGV